MSAIPQVYIDHTCKFGQGEKTCRYLLLGGGGFACAKTNVDAKAYFDKRVKAGEMSAKGDNCGGWSPEFVQIGDQNGVS